MNWRRLITEPTEPTITARKCLQRNGVDDQFARQQFGDGNVAFGSKARITAVQQQWPLLFNQLT
jgi:hypothetical protein